MTMATNSNVTDDRHDVQEVRRTSGLEMGEQCMKMDFYLYAILAGTMCLFGFAANTINLMMVRKHRSSLLHCVRVDRMISDFDLALQATVVADVFLLWSVFIGHVIPSLAYVIPMLRHCVITCQKLAAINRPLSALAQVLVLWLTTAAVVRGQSVVADNIINTTRRRSLELSATATEHSTFKMKLTVTAILLTALAYAAPMTFDHSIRIARSSSSSSSSRDETVKGVIDTTLADDPWYRLLYVNALSILVVVLPLVCLLGIAISLPKTWMAMRRTALDLRQAHGREQCLVQQLQRGGRGGLSSQLNDVMNIATVLTFVLLVVYLPQVALRVIAWLDGSWRRFSCRGPDSDVFRDNVPWLVYGACQLLVTANSMLKLPVLCLASRQYRDCLRRICCFCGCKTRAVCSRSVRITTGGRRHSQQQQQRHSKQAGNETRCGHRSSIGVALISSSSEGSNRIGNDDDSYEHGRFSSVECRDLNLTQHRR